MKNLKNLPHESGIYLVTNLINGAHYIGQAVNIYKRFNSHHIYDYINPNNSCYETKFYKALRDYGIENFEVNVLELCPKHELDEKEVQYISKYDSYHHGYNSTEGGQNFSPNIHSQETKQKRKDTLERTKALQGDSHPRAKITNEEVVKVRQRYIDGESIDEIYQDYKDKYTNKGSFQRVILGKTYTKVGNIPTDSQKRYTNSKLTAQQILEIRKRYDSGDKDFVSMAKDFGVSDATIRRVAKRQTYKNIN